MSDLISRQAAIDAIEKNAYRHTYLDQIIDIVSELPPAQPEVLACGEGVLNAQPERKKGNWIKRDVSRQIHGISCSAPNWQCSVCKKWWFHNGEGLKWYKFCPECGADMRG